MREFWQALRANNIHRDKAWDPLHLIDADFRLLEFIGEFGELCNCMKKLKRQTIGLPGSRATIEDLAEEIADVVITLDLLVMHHDPALLLYTHPIEIKRPSNENLLRHMAFVAGQMARGSHSLIWSSEFVQNLYTFADNLVIDLQQAVIDKFNKTSAKVGLPSYDPHRL